jgi:hypothetical protein
MHQGIGEQFARAIATKDRAALRDLLAPEIDFVGMTPGRVWETTSASALVDDIILGAWFDPGTRIDELESVQVGAVADRPSLVYRVRVTTPDGAYLVEQHAYFGVEGDRINWLRMMCSGFRAVAPQ